MPVMVLKNDFPKVAARLTVAGKVGERAAAKRIASAARQHVPVRTGRLLQSIRAEGNAVLTDVRYSRFVEFGTSRMAAEPFFFDAVDREQPLLLAAMMEALR